MSKDKTISIKLVKSGIGRMGNHKLCIKGLGFKKLNQTVKVLDTPSNCLLYTSPSPRDLG